MEEGGSRRFGDGVWGGGLGGGGGLSFYQARKQTKTAPDRKTEQP